MCKVIATLLCILPALILISCGNAVSGSGAGVVSAEVDAQMRDLNATIDELELLNNKLICYLAVEQACKNSSNTNCVKDGHASCDKTK